MGSIMIAFVIGIIGVTYYSVVVAIYGPALFLGGIETLVSLVVLFFFHFLLVMLLWSYSSVVLTDPGGVPLNWGPLRDEEIADMDPLVVVSGYEAPELVPNPSPVVSDATNQEIRFCQKSSQFKPPRTHHCSVCKRCILKMDHHCVWVVNCIGALNYKYFLLFLIFVAFFSHGEISGTPGTIAAIFITFVLNIAFAFLVMGFLIMHISLVAANTTTIEAFEKKRTSKWPYDLGWKKNFEQVFGTDKKFWFFPAYSREDLRRIPA